MKIINLTSANSAFTTVNGNTVNMRDVFEGIVKQVGAYARKGGREMPEEDLEDLRQEAFRKALISQGSYDPKKSNGCPQAYGAAISRRLEWDEYRKMNSRKARLSSIDALPLEMEGEGFGASSGLESEEAVSYIEETLSKMKESHRTVLQMALEGYSADEMAESLDCSVGAVYTRLCKARKAFAAALGRKFLSGYGYRLSA